MTPSSRQQNHGLTLIEVVVVILVVAVLAAPLSQGFLKIGRSLIIMDESQKAVNHAEECAEHVLATRRNTSNGFANVVDNMCSFMPTLAGVSAPLVTVTDASAQAYCPTIASACKDVHVAVSVNGVVRAEVSLLLVNS